MSKADKHIHYLLELSDHLKQLAIQGSESAEDDSCLLLYSVVQDYAYKMTQLGKQELLIHEKYSNKNKQLLTG